MLKILRNRLGDEIFLTLPHREDQRYERIRPAEGRNDPLHVKSLTIRRDDHGGDRLAGGRETDIRHGVEQRLDLAHRRDVPTKQRSEFADRLAAPDHDGTGARGARALHG